jgi:hypothetical protein
MSDRERWIVYPLLLMALGLALQPKFKTLDAQFGEIKCAKLICNELAAGDAHVARRLDTSQLDTHHLDAAQLKSGVAALGILKAEAANIDIVNSKLQNSQHVRVTDAAGMLHAEVRSTNSGGQFDVVRYTHGGPARKNDEELRIFASDARGNFVPLGIARLHWVDPKKTEVKAKPVEVSSEKPVDRPESPPTATEPPVVEPPEPATP